MKRNIFFISSLVLVWVFAFSFNALSSPVESEPVSKIQNIVLYSDRAMIKKEAVFHVQKGENLVKITGITPYLMDESVQVSIKGKSAVKVIDVKVEKTHLQKTKQEKVHKLQTKLENLNERIKEHTNEIASINSSSDFLKKVIPFAQNQKVSSAEVAEYARFLEKTLAENYAKIAKIEGKIKILLEEKKAVESELKDAQTSKDKSKSILVTLQAKEGINEAVLSYAYLVEKAGWSLHYDMRADSSAGKIEASCFALISQATGEDWKAVDIEISTTKPFISTKLPELAAWYVDIFRPRYALEKSKVMQDKGEMMFMESKAPALESPFEEAAVETEATSFRFIIPRKVNIPSDGEPHKIFLTSGSKEAKLTYYAVPKLSQYAFLRANFKNPFAFPLLPGHMNVFLDERLVSAVAQKKTILPDEEMSLSLGVDEGITIERKLQKKFTEYAGVFSKDTKVKYEFTIDIANGKGREIVLDLMDQFPVSRNEKIKVETDAPKKDEAKIAEDGLITWNLRLAPHEKKTLNIKFSVEHPKDLKITGLE